MFAVRKKGEGNENQEGTWVESTIINSVMVLGKLDLTISRAVGMICNALIVKTQKCPNTVHVYQSINHLGYDTHRIKTQHKSASTS